MRNKNIYSAAFLYFFLFSSHQWSVFVLFSFWEEVFEENIRNSNRRSNLQNIRFFSTAFFTTPPCGWLQIFPRLITRSAVYYKVRGWLQIKTPEFIRRRQVWFYKPRDYYYIIFSDCHPFFINVWERWTSLKTFHTHGSYFLYCGTFTICFPTIHFYLSNWKLGSFLIYGLLRSSHPFVFNWMVVE